MRFYPGSQLQKTKIIHAESLRCNTFMHSFAYGLLYSVSSYRPWNFGITKKWSILTKLKIAKENINQNMTPFDILKVFFFRPTFFRPILKSGISTDYYCFNHKFKYKSKGIEVNGVGIHLI